MRAEELRTFLLESNKAGYASGEERAWKKEKDGSTTIEFTSGDWRSHDNFFGGEPYGGRLVVFYKNKPVWIMVYYGEVKASAKPENVYKVLQKALSQMPGSAPFRGPDELKHANYTYTNKWEGDIAKFTGSEKITEAKKTTYSAEYMGGLVDERKGV